MMFLFCLFEDLHYDKEKPSTLFHTLHHHVNKVVRIRHHYLTGTSSVQYCSVNYYKSPDNHEESSGKDLCEKVSSERFSEKEFYEQSLIDIMGSRVHIIL